MKLIRVCILVVLLAALTATAAWRYGRGLFHPPAGIQPKVVILAMDGLDPVLLSRFMDQGWLPNFSQLAKQGTCHPLATVLPPQSPVAWASFITGLSPAGHGIFDFMRRDPRTYALDLTTADRHKLQIPWRGSPFWDEEPIRSLGFRGMRMPLTFPPPPLSNGRLLAGMGVFDIRGTEGTYMLFTTHKEPLPTPNGLFLPLERPRTGGIGGTGGAELVGQIPGPLLASDKSTLSEGFSLSPAQGGATLRVSGRQYNLPAGQWSEWIRVKFRLPDARETLTLTRAIFEQHDQDSFLYLSPVCFDPEAPMWPISYPDSYAANLAAAIGPFNTRGMPFDIWSLTGGVITLPRFLEQCASATQESERMLRENLVDFHAGVLFTYFEAADMAQHMSWWATDEKSVLYREPGVKLFKDRIAQTYEDLDGVLGRARAAAGPDTTVLVLSDHGFTSCRSTINVNAMLVSMGYMTLLPGRDGSRTGYADVDWARTQAYGVGFNGIFLNVAGREGRGIVPRFEAPALAAQIGRRLEGVVDETTREHPIVKVHIGTEAYGGQTNADCPDLIVGYGRGYCVAVESATGAAQGPVIKTNHSIWSGDHMIEPSLVPGVFLSSDRRLDADGLVDVGRALNKYLAGRLNGTVPPLPPAATLPNQ